MKGETQKQLKAKKNYENANSFKEMVRDFMFIKGEKNTFCSFKLFTQLCQKRATLKFDVSGL